MPERRPATPHDPISDIAHGVPPVAVSSTSTRVNRTGSWKNIRPIYQDKVAPCNQGCPVGIDIEAYLNLVREGKLDEAVELLLAENPLPATTGRVCYHPCESACNRARFDEAVSIHAVERTLGDRALSAPAPPAAARRRETVGVIGSGPAGLSCAYHLARMGYGVTVYEADPEPGGILRYGIPEYRLPRAVLDAEIARIRELGVAFRCGARVGGVVPLSEVERHDAVFAAPGAQRPRPLAIEGADLTGVHAGLEFLRAVDAGRRPQVGRRAVVVGGDATAVDCARTARRLGAQVLVLSPEAREAAPAHAEEIEDAIREGVRFEFAAEALRLVADENVPDVSPLGGVESSFGEAEGGGTPAHVAAVEWARRGGNGDGTAWRGLEPADTVLIAMGEDADLGFLPRQAGRRGEALAADALGATGLASMYAGGDAAGEARTVAHAIGSGKRAALGIDAHLRRRAGESVPEADLGALRFGPSGNLSAVRWKGQDPVRRAAPVNEVVAFEQLNIAHFAHVARWPDRVRPPAERLRDFAEANLGLTPEGGLAEAGRCFNCGVCNSCELCLVFCPDVAISRRATGGFQISYKYCKGCGVCAAECPRCAMAMTREGL